MIVFENTILHNIEESKLADIAMHVITCGCRYGMAQLQGKTHMARSRMLYVSFSQVA